MKITGPKTGTEFKLNEDKRILIVRLSAIGDVIETLPAVHALRKSLPQAFIGWVLEDAPYSLLQGHPEINRFFLFPKKDLKTAIKRRNIKAVWAILNKLGEELKAENFDLVLDMHNLFKSGIVTLLSGATERVGYGLYREGSKFFLTRRIPPPVQPRHFVDWQLNLVYRLGVVFKGVEFVLPDFKEEEEVIKGFLQKNGVSEKYFCLAPGTSWPSKCWTIKGMAELADRLSAYGRVVIIGSEQDRPIAEAVIAAMKTTPVSAVGRLNLRELAVLLRHAELYLGGDTGPMHLAVAVGTQTVAWFGPTSPEKTGPYQRAAVIIKADSSCPRQPCFKRRCKSGSCLRELDIGSVWEKVAALL